MKNITTKEFENKVKGWKIYSRGGINMSPYTGVPFNCGCGSTHKYNNIDTPPFMDNHGTGQMCLMVKECKYLNAVELRGKLNIDRMENLFRCKFSLWGTPEEPRLKKLHLYIENIMLSND